MDREGPQSVKKNVCYVTITRHVTIVELYEVQAESAEDAEEIIYDDVAPVTNVTYSEIGLKPYTLSVTEDRLDDEMHVEGPSDELA